MRDSRRNFMKNSFPALMIGIYSGKLFIKNKAQLYEFFPNGLKMLSSNMGFYTEKGGTIGIYFGNDGINIIDSQFPDTAQNLIKRIQEKSQSPFQYLINTHHHGDHTSGNGAFANLVNDIIAHENSKKNQENTAKLKDQKVTLPTITFHDSITLNTGKQTGDILMFYFGSAHTDGDSVCFIENENVVHTGDLVFNRKFPYIDKSAGASIENWIVVLDKINADFDKKCTFIFGHSGNDFPITGSHEDIKAFKNYLEKLLNFGQQCITQGRTLEQSIKETSTIPGAPEWQGEGVSRSLEAVYAELK